MRLKIRCDGKFKKFYKIFWELNKASSPGAPREETSDSAVVFINKINIFVANLSY